VDVTGSAGIEPEQERLEGLGQVGARIVAGRLLGRLLLVALRSRCATLARQCWGGFWRHLAKA